jgi:small ligand-binding sensory domain FIST
MKWVSAVSEDELLEDAVRQAGGDLRRQLGARAPDLTVVFASRDHEAGFERLPQLLAEHIGGGMVIGCSAGGVIGGGKEVEHRAGLSLTGALLPNVTLTPFSLKPELLPESDAEDESWEELLGIPRHTQPEFLLFPDPFTFDAERLVGDLDRIYPGSCKVGGLASGGRGPGGNALFVGNELHRDGIVGLALSGDIAVDTIVAQGCRPIGEPMFATRCVENLLLELDGRPARDVLHRLHTSLDAHDRELLRQSPLIGIVMKENQDSYSRGDFLIRNLLGVDPESGALAIGTALREHQVVQFHLRDARTSAEDLEELLKRFEERPDRGQTEGALLFSCLGRGLHLYGEPDHDTQAFRRHLGPIPLGGFFCNGEIGPVHGTTFLHGFTSSFGLFRTKS